MRLEDLKGRDRELYTGDCPPERAEFCKPEMVAPHRAYFDALFAGKSDEEARAAAAAVTVPARRSDNWLERMLERDFLCACVMPEGVVIKLLRDGNTWSGSEPSRRFRFRMEPEPSLTVECDGVVVELRPTKVVRVPLIVSFCLGTETVGITV